MTSTGADGTATPRAPWASRITNELRTPGTAITLAVLFTVTTLQLGNLPPVPRLQMWLFDSFQRLMPRERVSAPATIVEIDDKSLNEFGQWPWPRTRLAELIDKIAASEPAVICLEGFFTEPDRLSPDRYADSLEQRSPELAAQLRSLPSNDALLARAIARGHVVLPIAGRAEPGPNIKHFVDLPTAQAVAYSPANLPLLRFLGVLQSVDEIQDAAAGRGLVSVLPGEGGVLRTVPLVALIADTPVAHMGLELLRIAMDSRVNVTQSSGGLVDVQLGPSTIKAQANGEKWMRFGHHTGGIYLSAVDVLAGRVDNQRLNRRVVIVAVTAMGLTPGVATPLGERIPGAEIHAQLIEQLFDKTPLYRSGYSRYLETLAALVACTVGAGLLGLLFYSGGILVDVATPIAGWQLTYVAALATSLMIARRAHRRAVYMFSRFVNPHVVRELLKADSLTKLGESRELTILFSDIRNFTALSERRSPGEVVSLLNAYFTNQVDVLFRHMGALDKFIGDSLMAFWGAPLDDTEHATHAVDCALDMITVLDSFRSEIGGGGEDFDIGIGLHTGRAVVGLVGSDARREYTAIGAAVNVASRVEELTKVTKRRVLVSRETMERCGDAFVFDYVGSFSVKGVERHIEVYEPRRR